MHYLDESTILIFLLQFGLLLGLARVGGLIFQRFGQPAITAEILVGVICGPTLFGRFAPDFYSRIFPDTAVQHYMLDTVAWLGILFFLLQTGLETDLGAAWRQRRDALLIAASDLIIPLFVGFMLCLFVPAHYLTTPESRVIFALFIGTIMTISALPVTARVLQELGIYRTDAGVLMMGALTVNDVAGWVLFAVILSFAADAGMPLSHIPLVVGATLAFAAFSLTIGTGLTNRLFTWFHRRELPEPGTSLTTICLLGVLGGAITLAIGIHALFGFFIVGIMAGECRSLSENTRQLISQTVRATMVPIFFATIGLKIDFIAHFDLPAVLFLTVVGVGARFAGAWVGVMLTGRQRILKHLISAAHTPGGEMQIVIGILAIEYGVVTQRVFVAIVCSAVLSSILLGPWMRWALQRQRRRNPLDYFAPETFTANLQSVNRDDAIREMCTALAAQAPGVTAETMTAAVLEREGTMSTGLEHGVALPHGRIPDLVVPRIAVARSTHGIPWNTPDGLPVNLIFLLITPVDDKGMQLRILRAIALGLYNPVIRTALLEAVDDKEMWKIMHSHLLRVESMSPPHSAAG